MKKEKQSEEMRGQPKSDGNGNKDCLFRQNKKEGGMETDGKRRKRR